MENLIELIHQELGQNEGFVNTPEQKETINIELKNNKEIARILGRETYQKVADLIDEQLFICDRNSFISGFKVAMKLLAESGFSVPKAVSV